MKQIWDRRLMNIFSELIPLGLARYLALSLSGGEQNEFSSYNSFVPV
jgi:hypothetical protein